MRGIKNTYNYSTDLYGTEAHRLDRRALYNKLRKDNERWAREENWDDNFACIQLDRVESFYERIEREMLDRYWEDSESDKTCSGRKKMAEEILESLWQKYEESKYE